MTAAPPPVRFRQSSANIVAAVIGLLGAAALAAQRWWLLPLLIPFLLWLAYAALAGTDVGPDGLRLRALAGGRRIPWSEVESVAAVRRGVAVRLTNGHAVVLPSVRPADISRLVAAGGADGTTGGGTTGGGTTADRTAGQ